MPYFIIIFIALPWSCAKWKPIEKSGRIKTNCNISCGRWDVSEQTIVKMKQIVQNENRNVKTSENVLFCCIQLLYLRTITHARWNTDALQSWAFFFKFIGKRFIYPKYVIRKMNREKCEWCRALKAIGMRYLFFVNDAKDLISLKKN